MRIVSLLPSATEIVYALGLGDELVGVTFECDEPASARRDKAVVVGGRDTSGMTPGEIDDYVRSQLAAGADLYTLHAEALAGLDPELILTQDLCRVCALPSDHVEEALGYLGCRADVVSLDPHSLDDVLETIVEVGSAYGCRLVRGNPCRAAAFATARVRASWWRSGPARRSRSSSGSTRRSPPGHWVPDLVPAAGGEPVGADPGAQSVARRGTEIAEADPDVVVVSPCGFHLDGAADQAELVLDRLPAPFGGVGYRRGRDRGAARPAAGRRGRGDRGDPASGGPWVAAGRVGRGGPAGTPLRFDPQVGYG